MVENKEHQGIHTFIISTVMFFVTLFVVCMTSYLRGFDITTIISNTVMVGIGIGIVLFLMAFSNANHLYDYDNRENYGRFFLVYLITMGLSVACAYLPIAGWPFLVIFITLSLFSNTIIGITAGALMLLITIMISGVAGISFILYFFSGVAGACLFKKLDGSFKVGIPVFVSVLLLMVSETACVVLYANEKLSVELFLIPFMNIIVSTILLVAILKIFSSAIIYKYRDKYMEINDPEYPLLVELKQYSKEEYYKVVHTSYFCDRIAKKLDCNFEATKAAGYYHRIGIMRGDISWEMIENICIEYDFPPASRQIMQEFVDEKTVVTQRETAILLFSDAVVSSILFLFSKQSDAALDYNQIIETIFKKKMESGILNNCQISLKEIIAIKDIFKEEKLYYDFLR